MVNSAPCLALQNQCFMWKKGFPVILQSTKQLYRLS